MTKEEKRIELAKIDGWRWTSHPSGLAIGYWENGQQGVNGYKRTSWGEISDLCYELPNYLESYDAMLRLIQKLPHSRIVHICDIANPGGSGVRLIQKTPEELGDAVLTAFGKLPPK